VHAEVADQRGQDGSNDKMRFRDFVVTSSRDHDDAKMAAWAV
jgi:hypothetical protein